METQTTPQAPCTYPKQLKSMKDFCPSCKQENSATSDAEWLLWQEIFSEGERVASYNRTVGALLRSFPKAS